MYKILANTSVVGKKVVFLPSCHSTNDILNDIMCRGDGENGLIVITDYQSEGKGQGTNAWISEKGENLTFSVQLNTAFLNISDQFYLNIITSLALCDTLLDYLRDGVMVKWPNDIYYREDKIAGILIHNTLQGNKHDSSILGIGLNINQIKFPMSNATSLRKITGRWYHLQNLFETLSVNLDNHFVELQKGVRHKLRQQYISRLLWKDETRKFESSEDFKFEGVITNIDDTGKLMIETDDGLKTFDYQQIRFME